MGLEMKFLPGFRLLLVEVTGTPEDSQVASTKAEGAKLTEVGAIDGMVLDLRRQEGSSLDAQKARAILAQCDRHVATSGHVSPLRIAILTRPGTIGQGIARMFKGHAYGLSHLSLEIFDSADAGANWLGLPADWRRHSDMMLVCSPC